MTMTFGTSGKKHRYTKGWPNGVMSIYEQVARNPELKIVGYRAGKFLNTFGPLVGRKTQIKLVDGSIYTGVLESASKQDFTIVLKGSVKHGDPAKKIVPLMNIRREVNDN